MMLRPLRLRSLLLVALLGWFATIAVLYQTRWTSGGGEQEQTAEVQGARMIEESPTKHKNVENDEISPSSVDLSQLPEYTILVGVSTFSH